MDKIKKIEELGVTYILTRRTIAPLTCRVRKVRDTRKTSRYLTFPSVDAKL
jgi:hypothetical protein